MGFRTERWLVKPLSCPRPIRYCPDCGVAREYVCSERFRINAQKKVIDVWLKYLCAECSNSWKLPVIERREIGGMNSVALDAFFRHDRRLVWAHAFDLSRLRAHSADVQSNVDVAVERALIQNDRTLGAACDGENEMGGGLIIHFDVHFACEVRVDRLLAKELGVARSSIRAWSDDGRLTIWSVRGASVNRPVRNGLIVRIAGLVDESTSK